MFRRAVLLTIGFAFIAFAADPNSAFERFDSFGQQMLQDSKAVGFAVAVIQNGKVTYAKGYGLRDLKSNQPVTTETLFATKKK